MNNDFITVAQTNQPANKLVWIGQDGDVQKRIASAPWAAALITVPVPDQESMLEVLQTISADPCMFLINGFVKDSVAGETFQMLSRKKLEELTGQQYDGVPIDHDDETYVARTKATFTPSSWWQLDRDQADGQPEELLFDGDEDYIAAVDRIIPGMANAGYIRVPSTTGRVSVDGVPMNATGCRYWFQVTDAEQMDGFGNRAKCASVPAGLSFSKKNKNGHGQLWTIFDPSVYTQERCIFDGSPQITNPRLSLADPDITVKAGGRVDPTLVPMPTSEVKSLIQNKHGLSVNRYGSNITFVAEDVFLRWDQSIQVKDASGRSGGMTVRQFYEGGYDRVRCQATFRDSESWNGALKRDRVTGLPYLHDFGGCCRYHLSKTDQALALMGAAS